MTATNEHATRDEPSGHADPRARDNRQRQPRHGVSVSSLTPTADRGARELADNLPVILAELAALRARMDALAGDVADLVLEIRGLRADQARRRGDSEQNDRDGLLGLLVAELVGDHAFSAADVMARGVKHVDLRQALACAGASNGRKLGHLLARLEARRGMNDGIHFVRIGADRSGVLWRVLPDLNSQHALPLVSE